METLTHWGLACLSALSAGVQAFPGTTVLVLVVGLLWLLSRDMGQ